MKAFPDVLKLIASMCLALICCWMPTGAAATPPGGRIAIINASSGLCLTPAGGGRERNGEIVQYSCDEHPSRVWAFVVVSGDVVEIANLNSGLCLTVAGGSGERNVTAVQFPCDGHPSRNWRIRPAG